MMKNILLYSDKLVKKYDIETCRIEASKHFKDTWMRKWNWDYYDLRGGIREAYKVDKVGRIKYEAYTRKKGEKKLIMVYQWEFETLFIITGSEG